MQTVFLVWFIFSSTLWINLYATPLKGENPTAFNAYPEQIHLAYGGIIPIYKIYRYIFIKKNLI